MGLRNVRMAEESTEEARFLLVEEKCQYQKKGFESFATQGVVP